MRFKKLFLGFLASGIAFILVGFYILTLKFVGVYNCPLLPAFQIDVRSWFTACDHTQAGFQLIWVGIALLMVALIIGLYGYLSDRKNVKTAKLEPETATFNPQSQTPAQRAGIGIAGRTNG